MSVGKLPALKALLWSGSQGKRRFRTDLSVDMISAPLDDVRHTMHVGHSGDVFGDTAFLTARQALDHARSGRRHLLSRTFMACDLSSPPRLVKSAVSLPHLSLSGSNGPELIRTLIPPSSSSPDTPLCSYGLVKASSLSPPLSHSDSLSSFTLDLGPSLMTELLEAMEGSCLRLSRAEDGWREDRDAVAGASNGSPESSPEEEEEVKV